MDRRHVLKLGALGAVSGGLAALVPAPAASAEGSGPLVVRPEVREMTAGQWTAFVAAVRNLNEKDSSSNAPLSRYARYNRTCERAAKFAHDDPMYLPWHRACLAHFQKELFRIDPTVVLPYWDWSLDANHPEQSVVLSDAYYGGNGNPANDSRVETGSFANWAVTRGGVPGFLRREYANGTTISPFPSRNDLNAHLNERRFSYFSYSTEIDAGRVLTSIGGKKGDLSGISAANDPLFWAHQCFVDCLWAEWQRRHTNANQYEGVRYKKTVTPEDTLPLLSLKVRDTLNTRSPFLNYAYQPWSA